MDADRATVVRVHLPPFRAALAADVPVVLAVRAGADVVLSIGAAPPYDVNAYPEKAAVSARYPYGHGLRY